MSKELVYLSDFGVVSSLGKGKAVLWDAVSKGTPSGIKSVTRMGREWSFALCQNDKSAEDNRVAALLQVALEEILPSIHKAIHRWGSSRVGVCVGSCDNGSEKSFASLGQKRKTGSYPEEYSLQDQQANVPAVFLRRYLGLSGPAYAYSTACASSASALAGARNLIRSGMCDAVIAGGVDIVSDAVALGFAALEAVSAKPCNPFSCNRSGINLGEAAALFLLTREDLFEQSPILSGIGESSDAHHMTAPDPSGSGAALAMDRALVDAQLENNAIDYINLHGTGTQLNDAMESRALHKVFEVIPPVSSTKGITAHTLGAAGALELGICWLALSADNTQRLLPVHRWDGIPDDSLPHLDLIQRSRSATRLDACMSNSFAFGGCNVSVIIERGVK